MLGRFGKHRRGIVGLVKLVAKKTWEEKFLTHLSKTGNILASCRIANISDTHVYKQRKENPEFAARMATAIETALDSLEAVAFERAKSHSDTLLIFLLKSHRPERYRENLKVEHSGTVNLNHYESASQVFDSLIRESASRQSEATISSDTEPRTES